MKKLLFLLLPIACAAQKDTALTIGVYGSGITSYTLQSQKGLYEHSDTVKVIMLCADTTNHMHVIDDRGMLTLMKDRGYTFWMYGLRITNYRQLQMDSRLTDQSGKDLPPNIIVWISWPIDRSYQILEQ